LKSGPVYRTTAVKKTSVKRTVYEKFKLLLNKLVWIVTYGATPMTGLKNGLVCVCVCVRVCVHACGYVGGGDIKSH